MSALFATDRLITIDGARNARERGGRRGRRGRRGGRTSKSGDSRTDAKFKNLKPKALAPSSESDEPHIDNDPEGGNVI